jgi:hypothetical protein
MKVKTTGTKEFKPIELVITIESEKELMALINMCGYNESIPDLVGKSNRNFITLFLDETRDTLTKRV